MLMNWLSWCRVMLFLYCGMVVVFSSWLFLMLVGCCLCVVLVVVLFCFGIGVGVLVNVGIMLVVGYRF